MNDAPPNRGFNVPTASLSAPGLGVVPLQLRGREGLFLEEPFTGQPWPSSPSPLPLE
ncbi:hypothetical protein ACWD4G_15180 [Streptomyces sp. NPDC002643]